MRQIMARSIRCGMVAGIALGLRTAAMSAQEDAPLPASPSPPPELQEQERRGRPPAPPAQSPDVDQLLQKLRLSRAEIEQRKANKSQPELPASADEPSDVKERKQARAAPLPTRSPELQELIEKVRGQPGGAEKLERAKKAGARIPDQPGRPALAPAPERVPGPWMGEAFIEDVSVEEQQGVLRVTNAQDSHSLSGLGSMSGMAYMTWNSGAAKQWGPLQRYATPSHRITGGPLDVKPYLQLIVYLANPGWYLLNFDAGNTKATLRRYDFTTRGYSDVTTWDNTSNGKTWELYPYVANLAAGYHYFYWIPEPGAVDLQINVYVNEASLIKL